MQRGNAKIPLARLQNASTAAEPTRKILPTVLHINSSTSYINGNRASRSRQRLLFSSSKLSLSSQAPDISTPDRIKHGLKLHLNL